MSRFFGEAGGSISRRELLVLAGAGAALSGCSSGNPLASSGKLYRMGERVVVGQLIYTVLETEWLSAIGSRVPKNKFLSVRLTINNSGNTERSVPLLELIDTKGGTTLESSEGEGLEEW